MGTMASRYYSVCLRRLLVMALVTAVSAWAVPPETVNIHGMLVDASGDPLPGDRAYVVRFFDSETGGAQLGQGLVGTVTVSNEGLFNLPVPLPPEALSAAAVWYELGIDTDTPPDGNAEEDLFPERVRVHSVPFALEAGTVAQMDADRIGDGTVDNTAFGRLAGVRQPIQAALDKKADNEDLSDHVSDTRNPHGVTKGQVGLGNVDNTSDINKPVSTATQTALDRKASNTDLSDHVSDTRNPHGVTKVQVGLGNADNTADMDKPVSTAAQAALNEKANTVHTHNAADITTGVFNAGRIPTSIARLTEVWQLGGNAGTSPMTQFLGTTDFAPLELRVNNVRAMRIEPRDDSPNLIGGFSGNSVTAQVAGATLSGGGDSDNQNRVTDNYGVIGGGGNNQAGDNAGTHVDKPYATVGGGQSNIAAGSHSTVGGGFGNTAAGHTSTAGGGEGNTASGNSAFVGGGAGNTANGNYAVLGGGVSNTASGNNGFVGGGADNTASNMYATVSGGLENTASADFATVTGGQANIAGGTYSLAAGRRAKANHNGAFVWGDSTNADVLSQGPNQFIARATGGVQFFTNSGFTAGVILAGGGSSWTSLSDRDAKENFVPVDGAEALDKVAALPISTWNYKSQDTSIRHIGPMAQDVYAAFGVGESDTGITAVDADGIAFAAIQGLNQRLEQRLSEKDREIAALRSELEQIKAMLHEVAAR